MYFADHRGSDLLSELIELRAANESGIDASQLQVIMGARRHGQIIMIKSEKDEPLGSVAYAKISKYTLKQLALNPNYRLHPNEYNEGKILYITDVFFRKNLFRPSLRMLLLKIRKYRVIAYIKNGELRIFLKRHLCFVKYRLKM